jgi:hypothetical protein
VIEPEAEEDAFSAVEAKTRKEKRRVTSSNPNRSWSAIEVALRALAKNQASAARSLIQSRRACVRAAPMPVRRSLAATKTPVR